MGLDAWVKAKTTKELNLSKEATGVCSGLFPMTMVMDDEYELGYLRKAYDQSDVIFANCNAEKSKGREYSCAFGLDEVNEIIRVSQEILDTHTFDEEGGDEETDRYTWHSKEKWQDVIEMFTKAKYILEADPEAKITYVEWF